MRRRSAAVVSASITLCGTLLLAACGGIATGPAGRQLSSSSSTVTTRWPAYHLNAARTGDDAKEPSFARLSASWTAGPLDGAVYAEPLIYDGDVIVATENDSVYAFDVTTGQLRWHRSIGTPRTSGFPCGDIMPLGITGTPVIDAGSLYVVGEVENTPGVYRWHLARLAPGTGAVVYNTNITPTGMDTNTEQQRSALNVSNGNVVVAWGGLDGDCGSYHGYVETVSESGGARVAQFHDTSSDNEGGIWAPSGPAVDSAGDIYVTTGNGSTTNVNRYDFSDSVLKLSPSLTLQSFFAPGPPQQWTSLNAGDTDLASVGPTLLSNGLLFAIGKGGRGYLLNRTQLPSVSNPGGGENHSARVCHATSDAAFSGLAYAAGMVYVPCSDGIAAVKIDSATSFHRVWYSSSGGAGPIVAGGLVWTGEMFGGTALYGLDASTGVARVTLTLPVTTEHFVTPASADGHLFFAAGDMLAAFAPAATS